MSTHEETVAIRRALPVTAGRSLEILAGQCGNGSCPTVYRGDDETVVVVQGYEVDSAEVPAGERLVEIPVEVLLAAADEVRRRR